MHEKCGNGCIVFATVSVAVAAATQVLQNEFTPDSSGRTLSRPCMYEEPCLGCLGCLGRFTPSSSWFLMPCLKNGVQKPLSELGGRRWDAAGPCAPSAPPRSGILSEGTEPAVSRATGVARRSRGQSVAALCGRARDGPPGAGAKSRRKPPHTRPVGAQGTVATQGAAAAAAQGAAAAAPGAAPGAPHRNTASRLLLAGAASLCSWSCCWSCCCAGE